MTSDNAKATTGAFPRPSAAFGLNFTWHSRESSPNPVTWRTADEWEAVRKREESLSAARREEIDRWAPALMRRVNALYERFALPLVLEQRARMASVPRSTWPGWYETRDLIAVALGAPEPLFKNGMWRHDRSNYPLEMIESAADLARLAVPDWPRADGVRHMLQSRERWQRERPGEPPARLAPVYAHMTVPGRGVVEAIGYPSFVDLGIYLMGTTRFLTVLAGEPELADAFMDFCFELSAGYTDYLLSLDPKPFTGLSGFGGDGTFFFSPNLYERYSIAWDERLFQHVRSRHGLAADAPCNLQFVFLVPVHRPEDLPRVAHQVDVVIEEMERWPP